MKDFELSSEYERGYVDALEDMQTYLRVCKIDEKGVLATVDNCVDNLIQKNILDQRI